MLDPDIIGTPAQLPEEIAQCVRTILTTPVGTVVLDRDFGVDYNIIDLPLPEARARYTMEIIEKIRRYEPRVKIEEVTFGMDGINGVMRPKVVLSLV